MKKFTIISMIFFCILQGVGAQTAIMLNDDVTVQKSGNGPVKVIIDMPEDNAIDILAKRIKARQNNTISLVDAAGKVEVFLQIIYEDKFYSCLTSDDELLYFSTRVADVRTYVKELLKE